MKWMFVFLLVLLAGSVYAEVESVSSGVFRGSMRHIVTLSAEDTVTNVAAGDYLSFRFPGENYLTKTDSEELSLYVRRYDFGEETMIFDTDVQKFLEIKAGEDYTLDIDADGIDDAVLSFVSLDRRGVFVVRDISAVPDVVPENILDDSCTVYCYTDEDCYLGVCEFPGTCQARCVVDEKINPPGPDFESVDEPIDESVDSSNDTSNDESDDSIETVKKGWFTRFIEWLARLV